MPVRVETDKYLRERIKYADNSFPFGIFRDDYRDFSDRTLNYHWHYDFEFSVVLSGAVDYYINDNYVNMQKGDCIFINSNALHMGRQPDNCERTVMFTVTFPASLLCADSSSYIFEKFFQPVLSSRVAGFKAASDDPSGQELRDHLMGISSLEGTCFGYELECFLRAGQLWMAALRRIEENENGMLLHAGSAQQAERMKAILSYVHANYGKKITVDAIAQFVNVSRAECFRCFKRFINKHPVEYINEYRLLKAAKLIKETEKSITEIYSECGFENASYFSRLFRDKYSLTPIQYRNA